MIEVNLVPDVKQELIKAQRVRTSVISAAIVVGIGAIGVVVLLGIWVFAVQTARGVLSDNTIKSQSEKLAAVEDIDDTLTIQNQLSKLPEVHDAKPIDSRLFDILTTINPPEPNNVAVTNVSLNSEEKTISIEAQASRSYSALEVFKKTITATKFEFTKDGERQSIALASGLSNGDQSFGEDASGAKVLRFTLTFTYPEELFSRNAQNARIIAPEKSNVTDSFLGVPNSLFTQRASDTEEGN
jgi:Tfp pilus assembly protein PilN